MRPKQFFNLEFLKLSPRKRVFQVKAKEIGLPPGSLIHVGTQKIEKPLIDLIDYGPDHFRVLSGLTVADAAAYRDTESVSWINLSGIHEIEVIEQFGQLFNIHPLALEDILNTEHRPKFELLNGYCLIILKMLFFNEEQHAIDTEQVSIVLGPKYVISFQEREGDVFDGLRSRLRRSNGRIRQRGPDYLAYALLDSILDSYFHILEKFGDGLAQLEDDLIRDSDKFTLAKIHHYKRELLLLRKSIWPLREVISELYKEETDLIVEDTQIFLRDLHDHSVQLLDTVEIFRDSVSGLQDLYMSTVGNRMNEIMKILTIMASIFIPVTFVAGIYGMNFDYMPELTWRWGYFMVWGIMLGCIIGMILFFRSKKWF